MKQIVDDIYEYELSLVTGEKKTITYNYSPKELSINKGKGIFNGTYTLIGNGVVLQEGCLDFKVIKVIKERQTILLKEIRNKARTACLMELGRFFLIYSILFVGGWMVLDDGLTELDSMFREWLIAIYIFVLLCKTTICMIIYKQDLHNLNKGIY